jgi:hypothetical protein
MQHAALVGKTKRITLPKLFFDDNRDNLINDNIDNFRPDQLPGATRGQYKQQLESIISNNKDNFRTTIKTIISLNLQQTKSKHYEKNDI